MEHRAGANFNGFHGDISMLSMLHLAWDRKIFRILSMKGWDIAPWKPWEACIWGLTKTKAWEAW